MMSLPSNLQQWDVGAICRENDTLFKSFYMWFFCDGLLTSRRALLCAFPASIRQWNRLGNTPVIGSLEDAFAFVGARLGGKDDGSSCATLQRPGPPGERDPDALFNDD
jgi:hypothetical protein